LKYKSDEPKISFIFRICSLHFPATTWVQVSRLYNEGLVVEVKIIAVLPEEKVNE